MRPECLAFAREWIDRTWRPDFFCGVITGPAIESSLKKTKAGNHRRHLHQDVLNLQAFQSSMISLLSDRKITTEEATRRIHARGYHPGMVVVDTRESLINAIAQAMNDGASAWDNSDESAWTNTGLFTATFWHDPSHTPIAPRKQPKRRA